MNFNIKDQKLKIKDSQGFTLIEILIVIMLLGIMFMLGLFISFDFYRNYSFRSEKDNIISILQKARSESLNNINQRRHGIHFTNTGKYIIFECNSTIPQCYTYADADKSKDIIIESTYNITISGTPFDVVFEQLSGSYCTNMACSTASPLSINISDGINSYSININSEGRIDWQ